MGVQLRDVRQGLWPRGAGHLHPGDGTETSFVYQVNTSTFAIEKVVAVGAVPKYVAVTPDGRRVLVTNWCSADLSVIDTTSAKEVARIRCAASTLAASPSRPTAVRPTSPSWARTGWSVWTSRRAVSDYARTGDGPRHLVVSRDGKHLFVTNNGDGTVSKLDRVSGRVLRWVRTGKEPRSLAISSDGGPSTRSTTSRRR